MKLQVDPPCTKGKGLVCRCLVHISVCLAYRTYRYAYRTYRYAYPVQASAIMHLVMSYSCRIHAPGYVVFGGCGGHLSMRGKVSECGSAARP